MNGGVQLDQEAFLPDSGTKRGRDELGRLKMRDQSERFFRRFGRMQKEFRDRDEHRREVPRLQQPRPHFTLLYPSTAASASVQMQ